MTMLIFTDELQQNKYSNIDDNINNNDGDYIATERDIKTYSSRAMRGSQ